VECKSTQSKYNIVIKIIDKRLPTSREVVNSCSPQFKVPYLLGDCRKGIAPITIDGLLSLLNFMGVGALLPEKFDDTSLFDFVDIDLTNVRNADKRLMLAKPSRLSSMR
jgi:hypothetical protein